MYYSSKHSENVPSYFIGHYDYKQFYKHQGKWGTTSPLENEKSGVKWKRWTETVSLCASMCACLQDGKKHIVKWLPWKYIQYVEGWGQRQGFHKQERVD